MSAATPTKRRALGVLDVNVSTRSPSSSSAVKLIGKTSASPLKKAVPTAAAAAPTRHASPRSSSSSTPTKKRALDEGAEIASPAFKKLCAATATCSSSTSPVAAVAVAVTAPDISPKVEEDSPPASARQSLSTDASSLFDNSTINLTTITEPDTVIAATAASILSVSTANANTITAASSDIPIFPPTRPRRVPPTREEFRQKAEILKLRLSLASYKVKTNQTDVPLDKLQVRPVPGMTRPQPGAALLPSMSAHTVERATPAQYWYRSLGRKHEDEGKDELPRVVGSMVTPPRKSREAADEEQEEVRLTSSGLRGGAAKGLLSLSQASL